MPPTFDPRDRCNKTAGFSFPGFLHQKYRGVVFHDEAAILKLVDHVCKAGI